MKYLPRSQHSLLVLRFSRRFYREINKVDILNSRKLEKVLQATLFGRCNLMEYKVEI